MACTAQGGRWTEMYTYSSAGLVLGKRLDVYRGVNTLTVSNTQAFDNEGKLTAFTVPYGSSKTLEYDSMGRPSVLRETDNSQTWANGTTYNAAGQLTAMTIGPSVANWAQTNTFNVLGQLTRRTISSVIDFEYTFPATTNNGQIEKVKDHITGEEVNYAYDALQRLVTAQTTGPDWGLSFGYDGFGNKLRL